MTEPCFIHLRVHSDYSIIDGLNKISALVKKSAEFRMPAIAITDFTNLFGLVKFYLAAHAAGIKPIIGADFLVHSDILGNDVSELTILAANNIGYQNLTLLISKAYKRGYNNSSPIIDRNWLMTHNEGLILLSGSCRGDVGKLLLNGDVSQVEECINFYNTYFPLRYYLELVRTGRPDEEKYLHEAIKLASRTGIPITATNDVRFINFDDFNAHKVRVAIHDGSTIGNSKKPNYYSPQQYMRSMEEMRELFVDLPEALINSVEIARRCNVTICFKKYFLPQFPTGGISTEMFLIKQARIGLENRLLLLFQKKEERSKKRHIYYERLENELKIINQMGFPGYFLIVMEFIHWSKNNGIPVGPGRGSGAGSLVAYALNITNIDPISFDLLFERFLNPERISMPDFDIDFCMEKRDLVIEHVAKTYGRESVSQIITFGTMSAKSVIRDVGRVLGYPYGFVYRISKLIPQDPGMTIKKAFEDEPQLKTICDSDKEIDKLIKMARKLEGVTRNAGKHAGGVVIAPTKITDFSPLYYDIEGKYPLTQFDKNDVEHVGLVKFDFLGLRTLTIINSAIEMINSKRKREGKIPIDIKTISLKDKKSFNLLQRSETTAVFQLESRGMKDLIKRLQPDCFEDIIALVALFRPGPLKSGMVDNFINRKHGKEDIYYPDINWQHKDLKPVLEPTYGIILYQEQVMKIAQIIGGYTLGGADILRRAIGKKKKEEMSKQRLIFKSGAEKIGINSKLSMKIFDLVEKFAGYGFNKSHSAAYALVSYQTLWLKAHYPSEFMAAVMTADMDNTEKIIGLIDECWRMGLTVLPPDINSGQYHFSVNEKNEISYGIGAIKGVGELPAKAIVDIRNNNGPFLELFDLCARANIKKLNRRMLEKLILSGACDKLGPHRAALMNSLGDAIKSSEQYAKDYAIGQGDMFGILRSTTKSVEVCYKTIIPWSEQVLLDGELETLGVYLTRHPISQYLLEIKQYSRGLRLKDIHHIDCGSIVTAVGLVTSIRTIISKRGNRIGICTLDDQSGRLEAILFADTLVKYHNLLEKNRILVIQGQVSFDSFNGGIKIITHKLMDIYQAREKHVKGIAILLTNSQINDQFLDHLCISLEPYRSNGLIPLHIYCQRKDMRLRLQFGTTWQVTPTDFLLNNLRTLVGNKQVELEFD